MKTELFGEVDGDCWEEICQKLLPIKYRIDGYTPVPAKYGGDLGIEGFTNSGTMFQCYVPDDSEKPGSLYEHQSRKITRDTNKLIENIDKILKMAGINSVVAWHFYTPFFDDKALIFHARKKEEELKSKLGAKLSSDFRIELRTERDFVAEAPNLIDGGSYRIPLASERVAPIYEEILTTTDTIIVRIREKLSEIGSIGIDPERLGTLTKSIYTQYQYGQQEYEKLQANYPHALQKILKLKNSLEDLVEQLATLGDRTPSQLMQDIRDIYRAQLEKELSGKLEQALTNCIVDEAIADWIVRCPIRF